MAISAGDRIGRFEILGALGAGGMGEVYRARDLQLHREVAIKILPQAFSADPDRRRRFEQEARAAGSLNHPNILAVHDVGLVDVDLQGGVPYIVTELLEGETLRQRMAGRPLPVRKVVEFTIQIASGLAAGHQRRIVHRDIKPENVFITTDGRVKILDFGLAKLLEAESSNTETVLVDGESRGPVMGTAAYMSPEQARGQRVDHRTDIFSLGAVMYEMLTGASPFRRPASADSVHAVIYEDPPPLPPGTASAGLERVVLHCLEKKPDERFQHVRDLIFDLESRSHGDTSGRIVSWPRARLSKRALLWAGVLTVVLAAAAAGYVAALWRAPDDTSGFPRVRALTDVAGLEEYAAISPTGTQVAYTATHGARRQIFVRHTTGSPPLPVTSDDADHQHPRWLPDGNALIYFSPAAPGEVEGAIYRISSLGGDTRQRIMPSIGGGDVGRNGKLTCFRLYNEKIQLVTATIGGGDVHVVHEFDAPRHYRYPRWSPDNRWIAYQSGDGFRWDIYLVPAAGGAEPQALTHEANPMRGLAWRHDSKAIIYSSSSGSSVPYLPPLVLWEVEIGDPERRQLTPVEAWYEQPDVHESGLVSVTRMRLQTDIWRVPVDGAPQSNVARARRLTNQTGEVRTPTADPHSDAVAFLNDAGGHANIWVTSGQGSPRQITFIDDPSVAIGVPIWSPDGKWIGFVSSAGNVGIQFGLWLVKPDGGELHPLVPKGLGMTWAPDGQSVYYVETGTSGVIKKVPTAGGPAVDVPIKDRARNIIGVSGSTIFYNVERALIDGRPEYDIKKASLETGEPTVIATIQASQIESWQVVNPSLSPDGKWLALLLNHGLTTNIWKVSTAGGPLQQVTDFGDRSIFIVRRVEWAPDGRSIIAAVGEGDADIVLLDGLRRLASRR